MFRFCFHNISILRVGDHATAAAAAAADHGNDEEFRGELELCAPLRG